MVLQSTVVEHCKDGGNLSYVGLVNFGSIAKDSKYSDWKVSVVSRGCKTHTMERGNVTSPLFCLRSEDRLKSKIVIYASNLSL
jgi:hypothetical protein